MKSPLTACEPTNQDVDSFDSRLCRAFEQLTTSVKRWILVGMLLNVAVSTGTTAAFNVLLDPHQGIVGRAWLCRP